MKIAVVLLFGAVSLVASQKAINRVQDIVTALKTLETDIKDSVVRTKNILSEKKCFCLKESDRIQNMRIRTKARSDFLGEDKKTIDQKEYTEAVVENITATRALLNSVFGNAGSQAAATAAVKGTCDDVTAIQSELAAKLTGSGSMCEPYPSGDLDGGDLLLVQKRKKMTYTQKLEGEAIIEHQMQILISKGKILNAKIVKQAQTIRQQIHSNLQKQRKEEEVVDPLMSPVCANVRNVESAMITLKEELCKAEAGVKFEQGAAWDSTTEGDVGVLQHFAAATGVATDGTAGERETILRGMMKNQYDNEVGTLGEEAVDYTELLADLKNVCDKDIDFLVAELDKASYEAAAVDVLLNAFNNDETMAIYAQAKHKYTDVMYRSANFIQLKADPTVIDDGMASHDSSRTELFNGLKQFVAEEITFIKQDAEKDYQEREKCREQSVADGNNVLVAARTADVANRNLDHKEVLQGTQFAEITHAKAELDALVAEQAANVATREAEHDNYEKSVVWLNNGLQIIGNATEIMNAVFMENPNGEAFMGGKNRDGLDKLQASKLAARTEDGLSGAEEGGDTTTFGERSLARSSSVKVTPKYIHKMLESLKSHMLSTLDVVDYTEERELKFFDKQTSLNQDAQNAKTTEINQLKTKMDTTSTQEEQQYDAVKAEISKIDAVLVDGQSVDLEGSWYGDLKSHGYWGRAEHCTQYLREFENRELNRWHSLQELKAIQAQFPQFEALLTGVGDARR